jgi:hypothetical protein
VSAGVRSRRTSRIPSILLSLFEPSSAKQSQPTSSMNSPKTSLGGNSPRSPVHPHLEEDTADEIKGDAPPLEVVRTSGTFGIQDDGSVHLLMDEPRPITPLSAFTGRPQRKRRDSDNGTVKSAPLGPVLYMGNPDPRQSIDESEESEESRYQTPRSLTPFEPENPTSPLESVLNSTSPLEKIQVERRSVDGAHILQVIPSRSDVSERAQSPSTRRNSETNSRGSHVVQDLRLVDHWTQTSPTPSISASSRSRSKRPLPRPASAQPGLPDMGTSTNIHPDPYSGSSRFHDRARPTSMPHPPSTSAYAQPYAPLPTSDLPLLIASHLLSNHASALMRHSRGLAQGAEMMKRMADESMQWGAVLLNMASGQSGVGMPMPVPMPMPPNSWSTDGQPPADPVPPPQQRQRQRSATTDQYPQRTTPSSASRTPLDPMYTSRPFQSSQGDYRRSNEAKSDRYTPIPPRMARRTRSHQNLYTEFYDEVNLHGRKGWDELHQAEDIWARGMKDLKEYLENVPVDNRRESFRSERQPEDPMYRDAQDRPSRERQSQRSSASEDPGTYRQSRRSAATTSVVRTDESFPDLLPSPEAEIRTGTDDSFRPQSFDLMTPPNPISTDYDRESTVRARDYARQRLRQPFSPGSDIVNDDRTSQPTTAAAMEGYESDQFHPHPAVYPILRPRASKASDQLKSRPKISTFDLNTEPPLFSHTSFHQFEKSSTGSTGGRKLKKRTSALHLQLDPQAPSEGKEGRQPSTAGTTGTGKSTGRGKRHWWSRKREGTGSTVDGSDHGYGQDWKGSLTTA